MPGYNFYGSIHGVFAFQMFTPKQCLAFLKRTAPYRDGARPNSMNKYGAVLDAPALQEMLAKIQQRYVQKYAELFMVDRLKKHPYAFLVDYEMKKQRSLAAHFDSSDITLNLCLTHGHRGGELVFYDEQGKKPSFALTHSIGYAIVHRGSHVHRAKPITSGARTNLILWCKARA